MRIADLARRHHVADQDILHAIRNAIRAFEVDDVTMLIGPAGDGALLEVGILDLDSEDPVIIHAMPVRSKFRRLL